MNVENRGNRHTWRDMPDIGDFKRRSRRSAKIVIAAPGTPGDLRRSRRSAYKIGRLGVSQDSADAIWPCHAFLPSTLSSWDGPDGQVFLPIRVRGRGTRDEPNRRLSKELPRR